MAFNTILLILLSLVLAGGLSYYQYFYKNKKYLKITFFLAFLRFLSIFGLLLLLINPVISSKKYQIEKTPLPIIVDNSESIAFLKQTENVSKLVQELQGNKKLNDKYAITTYRFDSNFDSNKKLDFKGTQTNIYNASQNLKQIYQNNLYPTILISDGNQTIGNDYVNNFSTNTTVYPIIIGDTTTFFDMKISHININKYAFLKNKFPVEIFLQSNSDKNCIATFSIFNGNTTVFKQEISFSKKNQTQEITALLPANKIGVEKFKAQISTPLFEKNKLNNTKIFATEVIDERSEIALISSINHPDLGVLKRAIESNLQRKVTIIKPQQIKSLEKYNLLILYQPDLQFRSILSQNKTLKINTFTITGLHTNFALLNENKLEVKFEMTNQKEYFTAIYNPQFNLFSIEDIGFKDFPSLENLFGKITLQGNTSIFLESEIRNLNTNNPLLFFTENGLERNAYLLGENIWKWRLESHTRSKSFDKFDGFIDKIMQYLVSNSSKKSLIVKHESFYNAGNTILITAEYFDKNYELDNKAQLSIKITNIKTKEVKLFDFLKSNMDYQVAIDNLKPGNYSILVTENNSKKSYKGAFEVLNFNIEKQFNNPDVLQLKQLATQTNGKIIFPNTLDGLVKILLEKEQFPAIQKEIITKMPLIKWFWLLILILTCLSVEWFVRKYHGFL